MNTIINKDNFYNSTKANWMSQNRLPIFAGSPLEKYTSESGSKYIYERTGVWRISTHWGNVASCQWNLINSNGDLLNPNSGRYEYIGFCRWDEFEKILFECVDSCDGDCAICEY